MDFIRIGDKVIDYKQIDKTIKKILKLREKGFSQNDTSEEIGIERSFISRLESLGEIRKGKKIALLGFPIANKEELIDLANEYGLDYIFLLTEKERWKFIEEKNGLELFNKIMEIMIKLRKFDLLIFLGSDMRLDLMDNLIEGKTIGIELGESPLKKDVYVDTGNIRKILDTFSK